MSFQFHCSSISIADNPDGLSPIIESVVLMLVQSPVLELLPLSLETFARSMDARLRAREVAFPPLSIRTPVTPNSSYPTYYRIFNGERAPDLLNERDRNLESLAFPLNSSSNVPDSSKCCMDSKRTTATLFLGAAEQHSAMLTFVFILYTA